MKQVIWLALGVMVLIGLATHAQSTPPVEVDKGEAQIVLKTEKAKKPAVFPHWQHQDRMECAFCHENEAFPTEWNKKTGHDTCLACHKKEEAPTKCSTCHPKVKKAYEGC